MWLAPLRGVAGVVGGRWRLGDGGRFHFPSRVLRRRFVAQTIAGVSKSPAMTRESRHEILTLPGAGRAGAKRLRPAADHLQESLRVHPEVHGPTADQAGDRQSSINERLAEEVILEHLRSLGYPEWMMKAIQSHAWEITGVQPESPVEKALVACDELAGFITAVAILRPEGIRGMEARSVQKKMKQKSFAAAVKREDIVRGAEDLGVDLAEHIQFVIEALAGIADRLGLQGRTETPA